jgi:hypothetical protein
MLRTPCTKGEKADQTSQPEVPAKEIPDLWARYSWLFLKNQLMFCKNIKV